MAQTPITSGSSRRRRKQNNKTNIIFAAVCVFVLVLAFLIFGTGDKFNEDVLPTAAAAYAHVAIEWLKKNK